ncbi:RNA polymerase sigma-70 factor [Nocardia mangyaensis]|uniref:RNA polymerase sigma-70 factor n=1 Tax=Nocardia mangyaensis TaxID=2213200 RepID=UPI002675C470|nr:RNA polymerase sigma-70 factor [Nocardia mangyaensis]MDO3648861.1 RNA polymerase sigma-70 factor [Nocardia mangyaensis]
MESGEVGEFLRHRPRLFALAYRMLGAAGEAEDAVQEVYLRWDAADRAAIDNPEAWLTTVTVNLCRTWLGSARARRETYVGPWLPEPVPTGDGALGPLETVEARESVSLALLTALERLNPVERAVFVLREAFGYPHGEIAAMLGLTEANSQQILHRASQRVRAGERRFAVPAEQARALIDRFLAAAATGDVIGLRTMLADDVVAMADGGGKVNAARRPVAGAEHVARYLVGLTRFLTPASTFGVDEINGEPALLVREDGVVPSSVLFFEVDAEGKVAAVRIVVNPDKLGFVVAARA